MYTLLLQMASPLMTSTRVPWVTVGSWEGLPACARSCPDLIKQRFVSPISESGEPVISRSGCYVIQLWDMVKEEWLDIVIDDR
jgi:hypothetical protein